MDRKGLTLRSRRGVRRAVPGRCSECGQIVSVTWRYAASSRGPVSLCSRCKPAVLERSFGYLDAMSRSRKVGRFEGSRRKH